MIACLTNWLTGVCLSVRPTDEMIPADWMTNWRLSDWLLNDWITDRVTSNRLTDQPTDWQSDGLNYWLTVWLCDCLTDSLSFWLGDQPNDCLLYWMGDRLSVWQSGFLTVFVSDWLAALQSLTSFYSLTQTTHLSTHTFSCPVPTCWSPVNQERNTSCSPVGERNKVTQSILTWI